MRVDLYGVTAADPVDFRSGDAGAKAASSGANVLAEDTAELSGDSGSVAVWTSQAMATAGTRESRVDSLRQAVESGSYAVEPDAIADAMIRESE